MQQAPLLIISIAPALHWLRTIKRYFNRVHVHLAAMQITIGKSPRTQFIVSVQLCVFGLCTQNAFHQKHLPNIIRMKNLSYLSIPPLPEVSGPSYFAKLQYSYSHVKMNYLLTHRFT